MKNYINKPDILKWYVYKILLIMRLTTVILMVSMLQVSASTVAQEFNYVKKGASLIQIFKEIKKQTGYNIIWNEKKIDVTTTIDANFKKATIHDVLNKCLGNLPLSYSINDKMIMIKEAEPSFRDKVNSFFNTIDVRGRVLDENNMPLVGAVVKVKGGSTSTATNSSGEFFLRNVDDNAVLVISFLGYVSQEVKATGYVGSLRLVLSDGQLQEVEIVSTGYQNIPKERATGSFTLIDSALINRRVSTNILERLDGMASGLTFHKGNPLGGRNSEITIRGRSTIMGNPEPLIVVDNFPYTGDIGAINPNDVENITLLKDAAAASIWGTKAGNGVIVITTKSGKYNRKTSVVLTSNINIGQKPKLFSQEQLSSKEYIEVEKYLFEKGKYNSIINNGYGALSPGVEILLMRRNNLIDNTRRDFMLDSLSQYDTRNDILKYYYKIPINQQYNLNLSGGSENQKFFVSGGFDRNLTNKTDGKYERFTINANNTYDFLNKRLQLNSIIQFTNEKPEGGANISAAVVRSPYNNLADPNGNPLAITDGTFRISYIKAQEGKGLLDWYYRPLDELRSTSSSSSTTFRLNNTLTYRISNALKISGYHAYSKSLTVSGINKGKDSYPTRTQINSLSSINTATGIITRPIAIGDILETRSATYTNNYGRIQLIFDQLIDDNNYLSGIAGIEITNNTGNTANQILYGYNPETGVNANSIIDFNKDYQNYYNTATTKIPTGLNNSGLTDRYLSYYANLSYIYKTKYILSASARKDESNIFGVKSNQKGIPLWSIGLGWELSKEDFYDFKPITYLKLRTTYGYNGNVDKSISAYLTATPTPTLVNLFGAPQFVITNPPNPSLGWEKVRNINIAIDYGLFKNRITGSIEVFQKKGTDLIGLTPIAPQTGVSEYKGNSANLITKGIDFTISSDNLIGQIKWNTTFLLSRVKDKVTKFNAVAGSNSTVVSGNYNNPLIGFPYNSTFSFKWAGLDNTGAPQGYIGEDISTNYTEILNSKDRNNIIFNGSKTPTVYGSVLNTLSYKKILLSFNVVYKGGYYLIKNTLNNSGIYGDGLGSYTQPDYGKRWQKAGDELTTNVPSLIYPANTNRQAIYTYSEILTYKGDHIRLQDIRISFDIEVNKYIPVKQLSLFTYANNLGIIWKANKFNIDPDSPNINQTKTLGFGLKALF